MSLKYEKLIRKKTLAEKLPSIEDIENAIEE